MVPRASGTERRMQPTDHTITRYCRTSRDLPATREKFGADPTRNPLAVLATVMDDARPHGSAMGSPAQPRLMRILRTATGNGTQRPHLRRGLRSPLPNLPRNRAHEANHTCTGGGLTPATSVTGLESTLASSVPVYAGNGLAPATSANGTELAWRQLSMPYCAGVALAGTGV